MSFITDRMLYGDIKVASQVIRESADLAASEADQRQLVLPVATTIFAGHMW